MQHTLIPPREPEHILPPMIYVGKQLEWEYKQIVRNFGREKLLDELELNALSEDGWERTVTAEQPPFIYFYFKRFFSLRRKGGQIWGCGRASARPHPQIWESITGIPGEPCKRQTER